MSEQEKAGLDLLAPGTEQYTSNEVRLYCHRRYSLSYAMMEDINKRANALVKQNPEGPFLVAPQLIHVFLEQAYVDDFLRFCEGNRRRKLRAKIPRESAPYHPAPKARASAVKVDSALDVVLRIMKELGYGGNRPGPDTRLSPKESRVILDRLNTSRETYKVYYQTLRPISVREIVRAVGEAGKRAFEGL